MILALLLAFSGKLLAMPPIVELAGLEGLIPLNAVVEYSEAGDLSLDSLLSDETAASWRSSPGPRPNFRKNERGYWFRFRLAGAGELTETTFLRVDYAHLDRLDVHFVDGQHPLRSYHTGDSRPYGSRPVDHRTFLFPLNELTSAPTDVYLRVETAGPVQIPIDVLTRAALDAQEKESFLLLGAYFGILAMMLLYNGFIFLVVRDSTYLFYLTYVGANLVLQFTLQGFGFAYLWPGAGGVNNMMVLAASGVLALSAVAFVGKFLRIHATGTRLEQLTLKTLYVLYGANILLGWLLPYGISLGIVHLLAFFSVGFGFYIGVTTWRRGMQAARTFAAAWFVYMLFIGLYLLDITGTIGSTMLSRNALAIGSIFELTLLSLAFADRITEEKELRLAAQNAALESQKKLNLELDGMVRARTLELEAANRQLREISITDGLTGLYNRRHFEHVFAVEYKRAAREQTPLAVLILDIDHFKQLNDTYGHPFGDLCLQQAAGIIQRCLQRPPDVLARFGGEEFVVLLPNTQLEGAVEVARKIRAAFEAAQVTNGANTTVMTVSIGAASAVPDGRLERQMLLKQADRLLYQAKHRGRNRVEWEAQQELPA